MKRFILLSLLISFSFTATAQCPVSDVVLGTQADIDAFATNYPGCAAVPVGITITGADITDLTPLAQITSIDGFFELVTTSALTDLSGMENLTTITGNVVINTNSALTSLTGLEGLTSVGGSIEIVEDQALLALTGLDNLGTVGGNLIVAGNSQVADFSALANLASTTGYVEISGNPALTGLTDFNSLTSTGGLDLSSNQLLTTISGFAALTTINGQLRLVSNPLLVDLSGLDNVTTLSGNLIIGDDGSLIDLSGLEGLSAVGGNLEIGSHAQLANLTGLDNVTSVGGFAVIDNNTALLDFTGLNGVTSIGGGLEIDNNDQLVTMSALNNLTAMNGELRITNNPLIASLDGMVNINPATITNLVIQDNSSLILCSVPSVCTYLAGAGTATISGNSALGCGSAAQVDFICLNALPVELADFTATSAGRDIVLSWTTISEKNNTGFEVQRSHDASAWEALTFVPGQGTTIEEHHYRYTDEQAPVGVSYYRLKQTDMDGTAEYSPIVSADLQAGEAAVLYPNPTTGKVFIAGKAPERVLLTDSQGRMLQQVAGTEIDLSALPGGLYTVRIFENGLETSCRVVKE